MHQLRDADRRPSWPAQWTAQVAWQRATQAESVIADHRIEIADSDIHWMEPRDVLLSELSLEINDPSKASISSHHGGACVLRADGSVSVLDQSTTAEHLEELLAQ